jgi:hypothetical protein
VSPGRTESHSKNELSSRPDSNYSSWNIALSFVIPSEAEGSAVPRTSPGNGNSVLNRIVISTGAYPDFLPRITGHCRVCAFL